MFWPTLIVINKLYLTPTYETNVTSCSKFIRNQLALGTQFNQLYNQLYRWLLYMQIRSFTNLEGENVPLVSSIGQKSLQLIS